MATVESNFENLKMQESTQKGKGEMLQTHKSNKDGNLHQSGEDSTDSSPSNRAQVHVVPAKGMVRIVPTQDALPMKEEKRDGHLHQSGEDSFDAAPSNGAQVVPDSKGSTVSTQEDQPMNKDRDKDVEMREPEDSTDAVPSGRPTATVSGVQQPRFPVHQPSRFPVQQQPCIKQETITRACPSSVPGPGAIRKDTERQGAAGTVVEQAVNLENDKDLILYEIAEQVAGLCDLRKMALRLQISESEVARIELENSRVVSQFYQVFQFFSKREPNAEKMFSHLLETLEKISQGATAVWLRKRLGIKQHVASVEGGESTPVSDVIPQNEVRGGIGNDEFYDIFLMHSGGSESTKKFQNICKRNKWKVKTSDTIPAASPVHDAIERILSTSTHLALIITENDCINYKRHEMSMTVEMALQLAYTHGTLSGRVLPIRCCQKRSLPLVLQALTGAHIDEDSFEERLVETIDTQTRLARMRENQD